MKKASLANLWHVAVFERDGFMCSALHHDQRCQGRAEHAHHVVYRSHLLEPAMWLLDNGIALSGLCHAYAHASHNMNLPKKRLIAAVDAVNVVIDAENAKSVLSKHARISYFESKGYVNLERSA